MENFHECFVLNVSPLLPALRADAVGWCKWKGFVSTSASLGLLCVAVGDGSISVFSVPFPDQAWSAERKVLTIEPVASVVVDSGRGLLRGHATCIAWGPPPDSEGTPGWVAAGCTTGETLLIPVGPGASKEIVCLNSDEGSGVLSLDVCGRGGGFEWETGAIVVTGCMDGKLRVWDITRPHNPLHTSIARGKGWVTSVAWVGGSINCIIASTANGLVTRFSMKAVNLKAMVERPGDFWGIHVNFSMVSLPLSLSLSPPPQPSTLDSRPFLPFPLPFSEGWCTTNLVVVATATGLQGQKHLSGLWRVW